METSSNRRQHSQGNKGSLSPSHKTRNGEHCPQACQHGFEISLLNSSSSWQRRRVTILQGRTKYDPNKQTAVSSLNISLMFVRCLPGIGILLTISRETKTTKTLTLTKREVTSYQKRRRNVCTDAIEYLSTFSKGQPVCPSVQKAQG